VACVLKYEYQAYFSIITLRNDDFIQFEQHCHICGNDPQMWRSAG